MNSSREGVDRKGGIKLGKIFLYEICKYSINITKNKNRRVHVDIESNLHMSTGVVHGFQGGEAGIP